MKLNLILECALFGRPCKFQLKPPTKSVYLLQVLPSLIYLNPFSFLFPTKFLPTIYVSSMFHERSSSSRLTLLSPILPVSQKERKLQTVSLTMIFAVFHAILSKLHVMQSAAIKITWVIYELTNIFLKFFCWLLFVSMTFDIWDPVRPWFLMLSHPIATSSQAGLLIFDSIMKQRTNSTSYSRPSSLRHSTANWIILYGFPPPFDTVPQAAISSVPHQYSAPIFP